MGCEWCLVFCWWHQQRYSTHNPGWVVSRVVLRIERCSGFMSILISCSYETLKKWLTADPLMTAVIRALGAVGRHSRLNAGNYRDQDEWWQYNTKWCSSLSQDWYVHKHSMLHSLSILLLFVKCFCLKLCMDKSGFAIGSRSDICHGFSWESLKPNYSFN